MDYQPNPFVNPNQRGIELPAGCKDLMDVLKMQPVAEGWFDGEKWKGRRKGKGVVTGGSKIEKGGLSVLESQVAKFLATTSERKLFSVFARSPRLMVSVFHDGREASLKLNVKPAQAAAKEVLRRIFQRPELCQTEKEFVSVSLVNSAPEITRVLRELLTDGFGVKEGEELMFHMYFRSG